MHEHDQGLAHDLAVLQAAALQRRRVLHWITSAGLAALTGCGGATDETDGSDGSTDSTTTDDDTTSSAGCTPIPEETAGPYPGDGSNSVNGSIANALVLTGIVRSDIRSSIAGASGIAAGVPLTLTVELVNTNGDCAALDGYAVYLWHCDREGRYSMYSSGITSENYLRGVQATDADGRATFVTIFPGCYAGRMPHVHFEVYRSANSATAWTNKLKTSQIAFPTEVCSTVYDDAAGYSASAGNFARISFATDNVFSDGVSSQLALVSGSVAQGYAATLTIGVSV